MGDPEMRPPLPAQASGGDRCPEMLLGERCHHAHGHDGWHRFTHSVPAPSSSSPSPDGDEMFGEPTAEEVRRGAKLFRQIVESSSPVAEAREEGRECHGCEEEDCPACAVRQSPALPSAGEEDVYAAIKEAHAELDRAYHGSVWRPSAITRVLVLCESRLRAAEERERQLMQRIDDLEEGTWPFEWTVATAERERRKKAEDALRAAEQGRAEVEQTITSLTGKWRVAVRDLASARARIAQAAALLDDSHDGRDPFCRVCKALAALTRTPDPKPEGGPSNG